MPDLLVELVPGKGALDGFEVRVEDGVGAQVPRMTVPVTKDSGYSWAIASLINFNFPINLP